MNRLPPERVWNAIVTAPEPPPTWAPAADSVTETASTASCRGVIEAKKLSVSRRKLSLLLTPSIEMLTKALRQPVDRRVAVRAGRVDAGQERDRVERIARRRRQPRELIGVQRRRDSRVLRVDQLRAAGDGDRFFELPDLERERNADRLARRDPDHLRDRGLEPASVADTVYEPASRAVA